MVCTLPWNRAFVAVKARGFAGGCAAPGTTASRKREIRPIIYGGLRTLGGWRPSRRTASRFAGVGDTVMRHADCATGRTWSAMVLATVMIALAMPAAAQTDAPRAQTATPAPTLHLSQTPAPVPQTSSGDTLQLSMDQAVQMALQTNLGIKSDRMNLDVAAQAIAGAQSRSCRSSRRALTGNELAAAADGLHAGQLGHLVATASARAASPAGAAVVRLAVLRRTGRVKQNDASAATRRSIRSWVRRCNCNFTQPLWRNLRIDPARAPTAERRARSSRRRRASLQQRSSRPR